MKEKNQRICNANKSFAQFQELNFNPKSKLKVSLVKACDFNRLFVATPFFYCFFREQEPEKVETKLAYITFHVVLTKGLFCICL